MVYIYILQLEQGKYYIGKTNNPKLRIDNHFNSTASEWTKLYKPIKVLEIKANCDNYDEDKITLQYMDKYGINNVRGGSFSSIKLSKSTIDVLEKMKKGTNDKCFICGKSEHFAKDCTVNTYLDENNKNEYKQSLTCEYCEYEFIDTKDYNYHKNYCDFIKQTNIKTNNQNNILKIYEDKHNKYSEKYDYNRNAGIRSNYCARALEIIYELMNSYIILYEIGANDRNYNLADCIITTKYVLRIIYIQSQSKYIICPIYMFDSELTENNIIMIDNFINNNPVMVGRRHRIVDYIIYRKKFEYIINNIPGSYKNGPWKQVEGLFGLYFNEETTEFSEIPPTFI